MPRAPSNDTPTTDKPFSGWRILALATITLGLTGPGQTIGVSVFIDHFADDLDLSKNAISAGYAVGTLAGSLLMPTVGRWIDRFGVRRAMTIIAMFFTGALIYMAGVQGLIGLTLGFFFIRMLGQGSLSLVSTVAVSLWFERRRGLALGIAMTVSSSIMALVPVALSFTIVVVGWRNTWLVAAATIALVVIPIAWFGMLDSPASVDQTPEGRQPEGDSDNRQSRKSVSQKAALRTRGFWALAVATGGASMLGTALNFHQISLLGESGFSATQAAVMFLPQVAGTSLAGPVMGYLLDRFDGRLAPAGTLILLSVTLLLAGTAATTPTVIVYATVFGIGAGAIRTLGAALIPSWFGVGYLGSIQGTMTSIAVLSSAVGPIAFAITESVTDSFRTTALLWAAVPLAAAVFAATNRIPESG